jgi:hypothetical protein
VGSGESGGAGSDHDDRQIGGDWRVHARLLDISTSVDGLLDQRDT